MPRKIASNAYDRNTTPFGKIKDYLNWMFEPTVSVELYIVRSKVKQTLSLKDYYLTVENHLAALINAGIAPDQRFLIVESPLLDMVQVSNSDMIATLIGQPRKDVDFGPSAPYLNKEVKH